MNDVEYESRIEALEKRVEILESQIAQLNAEKTKAVSEKPEVVKTVQVSQATNNKANTVYSSSYTSRMMNMEPGNATAGTATTIKKPTATKKEASLENKIGKNVMGILASVLIFISILIFGGMVYSALGVIAKVAVLMLISIALGVTGVVKMRRDDSYFVLFSSMAACGICAVYITFILMHFVFEIMPLLLLTIAMFIWTGMVITLSVAKDRIFTYICMIGIVITTIVCAVNWDSAGWSLIYYAISSVVLFALSRSRDYNKNIIFFLQLPIVGMILTGLYYESLAAIICITLFVVAGLVAQNLMYRIEASNDGVAIPVTIVSMLMVAISMVHMSFTLGYEIIKYPYSLAFIIIAALYAHKYMKSHVSLFYTAFYFTAVMLVLTLGSHIWILAILMLIAGILLSSDQFKYLAYAYTFIGIWLSNEQTIFLQFTKSRIPMLLIAAVIILAAFAYNHVKYSKIDKYILTGLTCFLIIYSWRKDLFGSVVAFLILAAISLYMNTDHYRLDRVTKAKENESQILGLVVNGVMMLSFLELVWISKELAHRSDVFDSGKLIMTLLVVLFGIALFIINNKNLYELKIAEKVVSIYMSIKITLLIFSVLHLFEPQSYIMSIVGLLIAIGSIALGFKIKNKSFRLYGLVLTLICVAKLILIDIEYESVLLLPLGFFFAGILCFAISWIYSKLEKKSVPQENKTDANAV